MSLSKALALPPYGLMAFIGGGGKTSLINALARELSSQGKRVLVTTSTHIWPPSNMPLYSGQSEAELSGLLCGASPVCAGTPMDDGKLSAPPIPMERLAALCDVVLVEADGSRSLPLKAHGPNEPVIPPCTALTVCLLGADGLGRTISEAAHRPELYAAALGTDTGHTVTPADALRLVPDAAQVLVINKAEGETRLSLARETARLYPKRAVITSLINREEPVIELWISSTRSY